MPLHNFDSGYTALVATSEINGYTTAAGVPSRAPALLFGCLAGLVVYHLSKDTRNMDFPGYI